MALNVRFWANELLLVGYRHPTSSTCRPTTSAVMAVSRAFEVTTIGLRDVAAIR